ncbi:hypothetical protein [uncultured Tenacibaculum sp.]|uniref:hypothetical protein n=1 Tax=uncultured Tenacibaculum sp. TaxID=174713 RepID=UPI00262CE68C|nr:hypothetical protein [uncultured Tenacibaculum sp.]
MNFIRNLKRIINPLLFFLISFMLIGCGIETYDAEKAYDYWENGNINEEVEIVNGQFWKSDHWTYEYAVFLKLKPSKKWKKKFFKIYKTKKNKIGKYNPKNQEHSTLYLEWFEKPDWFFPTSEFEVFKGYGGNYYWNEKDNVLLFFEMQL